jgi:hypothetical protein
MPEISIRIKKNGTAIIAVDGIKGDGCTGLTAKISEAIGITTSTEPTDEMYQCVDAEEKVIH